MLRGPYKRKESMLYMTRKELRYCKKWLRKHGDGVSAIIVMNRIDLRDYYARKGGLSG